MVFNVSNGIQMRPWTIVLLLFPCVVILLLYSCSWSNIPSFWSQKWVRLTQNIEHPTKDSSWLQINASDDRHISKNTVNILCFGDSITEGFVSASEDYLLYTHPYTIELSKLLDNKASGQDVRYVVYNRGLAGEYVQGQMSHRLNTLLESTKAHINLTVILGGTNDIRRAMWFREYDEDLIYKGLVQLHKQCHAKGIRTVAVTIPGRLCERPETNLCPKAKALRLAINRRLREFKESAGKKVILADLAERLPIHELKKDEVQRYWIDEVHFTREGYNKVGAIIFDAIQTELERKKT